MTQPHILDLARQGDPQAIAALMNQSLQPRGMTATVERQNDLLEVVLEAERVPSREALTAFVQKGIANLGVESIRLIRIVGQQTGAMLPAWMQELDLTIAPALPDLALLDTADSALPDLEIAPSVEVEPATQEPLDLDANLGADLGAGLGADLGAIASEPSALSFNESTEEEGLPESLLDTLDFEGLNFEDQLNSREPLSADPQQRHLEAQLESLWTPSIETSQDFDLSLDIDEPISEEDFQDLFAEDLSDPQDFFPSEFSGEVPGIESVDSASSGNRDLLPDSADMDNLFGEQVFSPESSSDLAEYSFDLGAESGPSAETSSDFFLDDPLDYSLDSSLDDSYESIVELPPLNLEPDEEPSELSADLFADSSPYLPLDISPDMSLDTSLPDISIPDILISDVSISDISRFDENEADEIALSEDSSQDLFGEEASNFEEASDFPVGLSDESAIDAAIADLFAEEAPESQFSESQLSESQLSESQFSESQFSKPQPDDIFAESATSESVLTGDSEDALDLPELDLPELDLPELGLDSEFSLALPPKANYSGDSIIDETQSISSDLFTEELQGLNEAPIEYVFGEAIEAPIAQDRSDSSVTENLATENLATEDLFAEPVLQRDLPLPLLEEQLNNLWAEQSDSSFELEEEPLLPPIADTHEFDTYELGAYELGAYELGAYELGAYEQPDLFGQPEEEPLTFGSERDFLLEPTDDSLPDRSDESDELAFSNPNAVLLDLPSEGLPPEDLFEDLLAPTAPEDFSLDLSDNPLDEQSDSLFQNLPEDSSEEFFLDDADSLAALSLDDLEEEISAASGSLDLMEEDTFIDEELIDSAIASLPAEFLDDSFSERFENPPETPLEIDPSAASADIDLSDFSDFSDNLPDEPLASLIHEDSSNDFGIEFLNEDLLDETELGLNLPSQPVELPIETSLDSIPEDSDLDLPLDFLGDRTTSPSLRHLPDNNSDDDLALDDDFLNLPDDRLDYSTDSSLENLFPETSAPIDRQSFSMEDLMPSQNDAPEDQVEEPLTGLPDLDEEIGSMQGFEDLSFVEDNLAGQNLDYALGNDLDEDIGNLSLELDPEVYTDEDTSIAATFDEPWLDPLDDEVEVNREIELSSIELPAIKPNWDDLSTSPELSQEQLEAQLEEFDRNAASSESYGTGDRDGGDRTAESYAEGNGQVERRTSPTVITAESGSSWLLTAALVGVSGLVAGLLGYVLWSKVAAPPTPQPSVAPAPVQPSAVQPSAVQPSAVQPSAVLPTPPSAVPAAPPAEPVAPPSASPVP